ncbi:MAG: undecaprenyldiphospho-muramoylpentapeptide beta-N-acetylglucosaminyltransferase [Andreesenia angusta]|nr:undecaprenyldiphospho-muramoylpentapeptide beta-N-acetylglucosaminyltransferase [Andreesenia angusta]
MKVLISGGGTGGHIYPAISIAKKIMEKRKDADILYIGTKKGLEADIVPKEGIEFKSIRIKGFQRKLSVDTAKSALELFKGMNDARRIIKEYKPDLVIGTGGYVCGPLLLIASLKNIPTLIHEQNAFPGATNRILSKFVDKIACGFDGTEKYFKTPSKITVTGNPIRAEFQNIDREKIRSELNCDNKKVILSFGGSGGQRSLNDAMFKLIKDYRDREDIQIYNVTGKRFWDSFIEKLKEEGLNDIDNSKVMEYCYNLPSYIAASDLIVTSAGAITIAEITALGIPSIIVPKRYTTENHQEYNARTLEEKGASKMILEKDLDEIDFTKEIDSIINNQEVLNNMREKSKEIGIINATDRIYDIIEQLI